EEVVDREPPLAREVSGAAAEREARDAGAPDDPQGDRQPERVRGVVDLGRGAPRLDAHGARLGVHADALQQRQVDDESVVAAAEPGAVVPAAADGDEHLLLPPEVHGGDHVRDVGAARDEARPLVDHSVVESADLVVVAIVRPDESSPESLNGEIGHMYLYDGLACPKYSCSASSEGSD